MLSVGLRVSRPLYPSLKHDLGHLHSPPVTHRRLNPSEMFSAGPDSPCSLSLSPSLCRMNQDFPSMHRMRLSPQYVSQGPVDGACAGLYSGASFSIDVNPTALIVMLDWEQPTITTSGPLICCSRVRALVEGEPMALSLLWHWVWLQGNLSSTVA